MNTDLFKYIEASPSPYHAVKEVAAKLIGAGFSELEESQTWNLERGKDYFVRRNGTSLIAFSIPQDFDKIKITAAHSDSPTFVVKENGAVHEKGFLRLNVEKYGGMIMSSFLDRPLSLAGRMMVMKDGAITSQLVNIDRDLLMIPNCAIHLNREVNEGYKYNVKDDMFPIITQNIKKLELTKLIEQELDVDGKIMAYDLYLYNRDKPGYWGFNQDFFHAPRIDNLEGTFAIFEALVKAGHSSSLNLAVTFDNEEVGSGTKQGANSTFLIDVLARIKAKLELGEEDYLKMVAKGMMVSCDNAHGFHPNHKELYDANAPLLNHGVVIKHNANQKYTTDSFSGALFKAVLKKLDVPFQDFYNHSNQQGGSTLGNISNSQLSLNTIDIGLAQWAMHSANESAGSKDLKYLVLGLIGFYNQDFNIEGSRIVLQEEVR